MEVFANIGHLSFGGGSGGDPFILLLCSSKYRFQDHTHINLKFKKILEPE